MQRKTRKKLADINQSISDQWVDVKCFIPASSDYELLCLGAHVLRIYGFYLCNMLISC